MTITVYMKLYQVRANTRIISGIKMTPYINKNQQEVTETHDLNR